MKKYRLVIFILSGLVILQFLLIMRLWPRRPPVKRVVKAVPSKIKGRIAIVLDDWGYNLNNLPALKQINSPLTLAVLPNLAYSKMLSRQAHALGYEIILHLPMEPYESTGLEKNTIMVSLDAPSIERIISEDLESISYARGVSNHMGSKATSDSRTMSSVFMQLKKKKLYFLDSYVSSDSVCSGLTGEIGVRFAKRDVFIDNKLEPDYIKAQLNKLKMKARFSGQAIGIGHDRPATLEVLRQIIPEWEKDGYKFVYLSDLVH